MPVARLEPGFEGSMSRINQGPIVANFLSDTVHSNPTELLHYIEAIEKATGLKAKRKYMPMQPGDVENTSADTHSLEDWISFKPNTSIEKGVTEFVSWYKSFYG